MDINELKEKFEIKCKKCGSTDVMIDEFEKYDGNEEYCGSEFEIICKSCHNNFWSD